MSTKLDASDPAIKASLVEVADPNGSTEWAIFGLVPKTNKLKLQEKGSGFDELVEEFNEGKVQFAFWRQTIQNKPKCVYISWLGEGVDGVLKGMAGNYAVDFNNVCKAFGVPVHVQQNARSENDLDEATIKKKLLAAGGSNYDAGAKKQGVDNTNRSLGQLKTTHLQAQEEANKDRASGDIKGNSPIIDKEESNQFWNQNQQSVAPAAPKKTATPIDAGARQAFWNEQKQKEEEEKARQAAAAQNRGPAVNKTESNQFWNQNQARPAAAAPSKAPPTVPTGAGAGNLRAKFEQQAAATNTAPPKPAPSGAKWSKPPAAAPSAPPPARAAPSNPPPAARAPAPSPYAPPPQPAAPAPSPYAPPPQPAYTSAPPPVPAHAPPAQEEYAQEEYAQEEYAQEEYQEEAAGYGEEAAAATEEYQEEAAASYTEEYQEEAAGYGEEAAATEEYQEEAATYAEEYQEEAAYGEEYAQEEAAATYTEEYAEEYAGEEAAQTEYLAVVEALYPYAGDRPEDLSFNAGDMVNVIEMDASGWWKGELNGAVGYFPSNFVKQ